ncbi:hypothetical protein FPSE_11068 [Fusarium pseudograminearum CS3096]|uniref:Uncharacterized protein n=1 Tax=Fusarium pseudograminearum (strain CS3096) TaxID=1028729 RepID=K3V9R9_FUSPC|nr:hypothetical protein FPSE_11068 [Fusarium pseudograminearum CS3096]EKJ68763.1 hypothetical protein FPSE_11068 [Fusarium pseudograminearum CS3096]
MDSKTRVDLVHDVIPIAELELCKASQLWLEQALYETTKLKITLTYDDQWSVGTDRPKE